MNDVRKIKLLQASHIPPYTYSTNFINEGLTNLQDRITTADTLTRPVNMYIRAANDSKQSMRRAIVASGLLAKALCILGRPVVHVHLAGMLREARMFEKEREERSINPVLERIGKGYIVIGDFLEFNDVEQKYGYHAVQLVADYLMSHLERGGGLILGASNIDLRDATQFGAAFNATLLDNFESYTV
jgi:hypothetical protein